MEVIALKPRQALNKAFLKVKANRASIEVFKTELAKLLDRISDNESEEFHKNLLSDFLKKSFYDPQHFINTKGRNDLVIHNGNDAKSTVGLLLEAKKPGNVSEMIKPFSETDNAGQKLAKLNVKAFHELVLYYLRERITHKNLEVKHLVVTNIYEWYIFDAALFDRLFAQNKSLVKQFEDFEAGRLAENRTDFFYRDIAFSFIADIQSDLEFTYISLHDYDKVLRNSDKADDTKLIALYKVLSPEHLLKQPFANDSNRLDKRFYSELLHIIGLSESKDGGKKLIGRHKEGDRCSGTMLEDAIIQLDSLDKLNRIDRLSQYGSTQQERLYNVAFELNITWINRILFAKLLEAQLITYHKGNRAYAFLNKEKVKTYDDLNSLFFQVLARRTDSRNTDVRQLFENVPYLNSSLFEPTELEQTTLFISNLKDDKSIPLFAQTVLKDGSGKKVTGELGSLEYLFRFLDAYDFGAEGSEEIQEDNKTLINASVLGLIFEKINGYKDGSFFTPGFITMYMCRETIRRAVVQKFNEIKQWSCKSLDDLYDKIEDRKEANEIVNNLKICDPAVGSGHFLVSALNEIIAIKSELKILLDRDGKRLKEYKVQVENDELAVSDEEGELFKYSPNQPESQRIQEALFHEKQTIIENCLFGVDINPNSVKICRLRLWIELLKNAYYKGTNELETLPNIDINIKCGNSLVSRFALDADLKKALKNKKGHWTIDMYRVAVTCYQNAKSKEEKRDMERLISDIKSDFIKVITRNSAIQIKLAKAEYELLLLTGKDRYGNSSALFGDEGVEFADAKAREARIKEVEIQENKIALLRAEIAEIEQSKIFDNAFEWRFEFPEVLNEDGDFVGFDVVIGNPPYISLTTIRDLSLSLSKFNFNSFDKNGDLYTLFFELGNRILRENGILSFIIPNKWLNASYGKVFRKYMVQNSNPTKLIDFEKVLVFDEAVVFVSILIVEKREFRNELKGLKVLSSSNVEQLLNSFNYVAVDIKIPNSDEYWNIAEKEIIDLNAKIRNRGKILKDWEGLSFYRGVTTGFNDAFHITIEEKNQIVNADNSASDIIFPLLRGKDIKRYRIDSQNIFLIFTKKDSVSIDSYPSIKKHLEKFKQNLIPKKKNEDLLGRKPGSYKWFEIQDNTAYFEEFKKEKIVWIEISERANFSYDDQGYFLTNSAYFISGKSLKYILAVLNSKLCDFYFFQQTAVIAGGRKRYTKQYVEQNPIAVISEEEQRPFITLVDEILYRKSLNLNADVTELEKQIDQLVYQLYNLTEEEIRIVEGI